MRGLVWNSFPRERETNIQCHNSHTHTQVSKVSKNDRLNHQNNIIILVEEHISLSAEHSVCTDRVDPSVVVLKPRVSQAVLGKRHVMATCMCVCVCVCECVREYVCM